MQSTPHQDLLLRDQFKTFEQEIAYTQFADSDAANVFFGRFQELSSRSNEVYSEETSMIKERVTALVNSIQIMFSTVEEETRLANERLENTLGDLFAHLTLTDAEGMDDTKNDANLLYQTRHQGRASSRTSTLQRPISPSLQCSRVCFEWLSRHAHRPYPEHKDKKILASHSGVAIDTITTWFERMRRRIGWTALQKKHFEGPNSRTRMIDAARRVLNGDAIPGDDSDEVKAALFLMKEELEMAYQAELGPLPSSPTRLDNDQLSHPARRKGRKLSVTSLSTSPDSRRSTTTPESANLSLKRCRSPSPEVEHTRQVKARKESQEERGPPSQSRKRKSSNDVDDEHQSKRTCVAIDATTVEESPEEQEPPLQSKKRKSSNALDDEHQSKRTCVATDTTTVEESSSQEPIVEERALSMMELLAQFDAGLGLFGSMPPVFPDPDTIPPPDISLDFVFPPGTEFTAFDFNASPSAFAPDMTSLEHCLFPHDIFGNMPGFADLDSLLNVPIGTEPITNFDIFPSESSFLLPGSSSFDTVSLFGDSQSCSSPETDFPPELSTDSQQSYTHPIEADLFSDFLKERIPFEGLGLEKNCDVAVDLQGQFLDGFLMTV